MGFKYLLANSDKLIEHMSVDGYSKAYIRQLKTEINWLGRNGVSFDSYEEACRAREKQTDSAEMKRRYRLMYGILKRFDHDGLYPDYRSTKPLFAYGAYQKLCPEFREVIDSFLSNAEMCGLKSSTIKGDAANASCFLLFMQERGLTALSEITEDDVLSFFTDNQGNPVLSGSYGKNIATVLGCDLGKRTEAAHAVRAFLPKIRTRRKNIRYLQPEEIECIRATLGDEESALNLRDKAIGALLFFAGLRACDIAALTMDDISWEYDKIRLVQDKTGALLALPLTAPIGNAIYDYLAHGRPVSEDGHLFLGLSRPHDPIRAKAVWHAASRLYDAAGIRPRGERSGTHLFRYNVATTMVGAGVARPVVSATLGHEDPNSLDYYLFADIVHLRECALDVGRFPVREGVFDI